MTRKMLWVSLPDQRAGREVSWMSRMPDTEVVALAAQEPAGDIVWRPATYRRPIKRFIEAGALAWVNDLDAVDQSEFDWVTTLELCSLVTGQSARWKAKSSGRRPLQAVVTWENLTHQPLYHLPPYRGARRAALGADLMLCFIDAAREHLIDWGYPDEQIAVVKPGVDTEVFRPPETPVDKPVIVFTSPLARNKGIDRVLDAMKIVRQAIPDAELHVAGRGELRPMVEERAADPGSGVHLHGNLDRAGVASLLREAALFVTAPRPTWKWNEQFGLAYLEALATGLPIVTTACGTNYEAVPPPNDLLADRVPVLAEAMIGWLEDPARRAEAGISNRAHVLEHHEIQRQCDRMGEAFAAAEQRR